MFCPGCGKQTSHYEARIIKGQMAFLCDNAENHNGNRVRKFRSRALREIERFEVPKESRVNASKLMRSVIEKRRPLDTPKIREAASIDKNYKRHTVFVHSLDSSRQNAVSALAMEKLSSALGPNPKIISNDGFMVVGESTTIQ